MPERNDDRVTETPTEVRAGVTGLGGRYVPAFSTIARQSCWPANFYISSVNIHYSELADWTRACLG